MKQMESFVQRTATYRESNVVLETSSPEIRFSLAPPRGYIPREGYFYPRPAPLWDASVAPRYELSIINPDAIDDRSIASDSEFVENLKMRWGAILENRQVQESERAFPLPSYRGFGMLSFVAFAPTTEQLFKKFIAPEIRRRAQYQYFDGYRGEEAFVAVPTVSYLFPFWSQEELNPVRIVEGNLSKLIKIGGKMDRRVCAVYLDYPPNQLEAAYFYTVEQLAAFIRQNPSVLFVVDQANLYHRAQGMNNPSDLMLTHFLNYRSIHFDGDLIVTNTTTKTGMSGCAVAAASSDALAPLMNRMDIPALIGFDDMALRKRAISVLELELPNDWAPAFIARPTDTVMALKHRQKIQTNRERLVSQLENWFDRDVVCPELVVEGARIIVNAKKVGFKSAQELCRFLYENFNLGTKPASIYASTTVKNEWDKYLQITAPWNDEMLEAFLRAFAKLKEINEW